MHRQISGASQFDNAELLDQVEKSGNLTFVTGQFRYQVFVLHIDNLGPKQFANLDELGSVLGASFHLYQNELTGHCLTPLEVVHLVAALQRRL